jgi:hypothetical protein
VALFEKRAQCDALAQRLANVQQVRARITTLQQDLAQLPALTTARAKALRKLEDDAALAEAALQAMAAGIENCGAEPVMIGERLLAPGEKIVVTEDTELRHREDLCLRIRPGGGSGLAEARKKRAEAWQELRRGLAEAGVGSATEATEIFERRRHVEAELKNEQTRLEALGGATLDAQLESCKSECLAAEADLARRSGEAIPPLTTQDAAAAALGETKRARELVELRENAARKTREEATKSAAAAERALASAREALRAEQQTLHELSVRLRVLLESHSQCSAPNRAMRNPHSRRPAMRSPHCNRKCWIAMRHASPGRSLKATKAATRQKRGRRWRKAG